MPCTICKQTGHNRLTCKQSQEKTKCKLIYQFDVMSEQKICLDDIDLFFVRSKGRDANDKNNKKREVILNILVNGLPEEFETDQRWKTLQEKFISCLHSLCSEPFDSIKIRNLGGRHNNRDFDVDYIKDHNVIKTIRCEYKHNAKSINKLPQYLSESEKKGYIPTSYADFYYTHYSDKVSALYGLDTPDRETYLRSVFGTNYACHPYFQALYDSDTRADNKKEENVDEKKKQAAKKVIVTESIAAFLAQNSHTLQIGKLMEDIKATQTRKMFILWDLCSFHVDSFRDDEFELTCVEGVKNNNTIIVGSKAGTKHNLLLRWRNHLGVLLPAWQISLTR